MKRLSKRAISLILSLCMLVSVLVIPIPVQAEDTEQVETPVASVDPSQHISVQTEVELTCNTSGASIYYTTDGSEPRRIDEDPTNTSVLYDNDHKPVIIANNYLKIQAFAVAEGMDDSEIAVFEYNCPTSTVLVGVANNLDDNHRGGVAEIRKHQEDDTTDVGSVGLDETNSTFALIGGDYDDGRYSVRVRPVMESDRAASDWFYFDIADGKFYFIDTDNEITDIITLTLRTAQIKGLLLNAAGEALGNVGCSLRIRNEDPQAGYDPFEWQRDDNLYKVYDLADGVYTMWIAPIDDPNYAASKGYTFTITDGVSDNEEICLQLTTPQYKGTVYKPDEVTPATGGIVRILDENANELRYFDILPNGTYSIGGLEPGNYFISAFPPFDPGYESVTMSEKVPIVITALDQETIEEDLFLREKMLEVSNVTNLYKGSNQIAITLNNVSFLNNDFSGLKAEINTGSEGVIHHSYNADTDRIDYNNNEIATWSLYDDSFADLDFGSLTVSIKNGEEAVGNPKVTCVIQRIYAVPELTSLEDYIINGVVLSFSANVPDYPWSAEDDLSASVRIENGNLEYSPDVSIGLDLKLTLEIPAQASANAGRRYVSIYKDGELLADGQYYVGSPSIAGARAIYAGDRYVYVNGNFLMAYQAPNTIAEVYKGGQKLCGSEYTDVRENQISFRFPIDFWTPGTDYSIKIIDISNEADPHNIETLPLRVVPYLVSTPHVLTGSDTIKLTSSSISEFAWDTGDSLNVHIYGVYGDGFSWELSSDNGLSFDGPELVVPLLAGGHVFPVQAEIGRMEVFRNNELLGYAEFIIKNELIQGIVKNPNGTNAEFGEVRISYRDLVSGNGYETRVFVGADGSFYITPRSMPNECKDGIYTLTAIPYETSPHSNSQPYEITMTSGSPSESNVGLELCETQISGTVKNADDTPASKGNVDIFRGTEQLELVGNARISSDGTFKIGGLPYGVYKLSAYPGGGLTQLPSEMIEVIVDDTPETGITLEFTLPQIRVNVFDADDKPLEHFEYDLLIRRMESGSWRCSASMDYGSFIAGRMSPGNYGMRIRPRGDSVFAPSFETSFTIDENGTAAPNSFDLHLTNPQLTGTVIAPDNTTLITSGNVVVMNTSDQWIYDVNIQPDGSYRIGGLTEGEYDLVANPSRDNHEYVGYDSSAKTRIQIDSVGNPVSEIDPLVLRTYGIRLKSVENYIKGSNELRARITNADGIRQEDTIRAELVLGGEVEASSNEIWIRDFDGGSREGTLVINGLENFDLKFGGYKLRLYHNNNLLDVDESDDLLVISGLDIYPRVVSADEYSNAKMKIDVNEIKESRQYPWESDDDLEVTITVGNHWDIHETVEANINEDKTLTIYLPSNLPPVALEDGWHDISVFRDNVLLAVGRFDVGTSEISEIRAEEASNHIEIAGKFMSKYMDKPYIEVYKDGKIIITSREWNDYWGNMMFRLPGSLKAGEEYQLKLYAKLGSDHEEIELPGGGNFVPVPKLNIVEVPVITGNEAGQSLTLLESSYEDFGWDADDNISGVVSGPGASNYTAVKGNGINVQEDSVVFTTAENDKRHFPWENGMYTIRLFDADSGNTLGVADFIVNNDGGEILDVAVNDSDGSPSGNGVIVIKKKGDGWSESARVYPNGKFYYPVSMLKGDGDYEIYAEALMDSDDVAGKAEFSVIDGHIKVDEVATSNVQITFDKAQVKGVVKEGSKNVSGGRIDLNSREKGNDRRYETKINYDGSYKLAGIEPGDYNIAAFADNGSEYLCSDNVEITVTSDGTVQQDLDLKLPQVTGTALDVNDNPLRGDKYEVKIRNLNPGMEWDDGCAWRPEDGKYLLGGLKPGNYEVYIQPHPDLNLRYSKSENVFFTIKEDGTADPANIDLQLTQPKVEGMLYDNAAQPFSRAVVDIFQGDWKDLRFVAFAPVLEDGSFYIGGIDDGTYYIRAALTDRKRDGDLSQSLTVPITIGPETSEVSLYLRDTTPRIKYIEDYNINSRELRVRIINVETMEDLSKLKAEIVDQDGDPLADPIQITAQRLDDGSYDYNKDEGVIIFNMDGITLEPGKYNLKLTYDNGDELENDTPDYYGFNGFLASYELWVEPFAVLPEKTPNKTVMLGVIDMKEEDYPWEAGDETLDVILTYPDGKNEILGYEVNGNKVIEAELLVAALNEGQYQLSVYKADIMLASGGLTVGYPVVFGADDSNDGNDSISINGENLIIYIEGDNELEVYDESDNLVVTVRDVSFEWGRIVFRMKDRRLAPGSYRLEWTSGGQPVDMQNDTLKVVNWLRPTPNYFMREDTNGKQMKLTLIDGSTPLWDVDDDLKVRLAHEGYDASIVVTPTQVTYGEITITFDRDIMNKGPIIVDVFKDTETGKELIATSRFDVVNKVQMKGRVMDPSENGIPYAEIHVGGDGWGTGFEADANGDYAIYGLNPGEYFIRAVPAKGDAFLETDEIRITISDETTQLPDRDLILQPGLKISGKVLLPEGETATEDIYLNVNAWAPSNMENREDDLWFGTDVVIHEGDSEADYSIIVPDGYEYLLHTWGGGNYYISGATYYNSAGSSYTFAGAQKLAMSGADMTDKNITLIKGKLITGFINLPGSMNATEDVTVKVMADNNAGTEEQDDDIHCEREFVIEAGHNSYEYKIVVPAADGYVIHYEQYSGMKLADSAFYKSNLESTVYFDQAEPVDVQTDVADLDITLLGAKYISGTVTFPAGVTAPEGGTDMWVLASLNKATPERYDDISFGYNLRIPKSGTSGDYQIKVPDIDDDYMVEFWGGSQVGCINNLIYNEGGPAYTAADATMLKVVAGDAEGIDLKLEKGNIITGIISLSAGISVPPEGITIGVEAFINGENENDYLSVYSDVTIEEGQNSAEYALIVPAINGYRVRYNGDKYPNLMREGFYADSGTAFYYENADQLDLRTGGMAGINLEVSAAKYITGTVTLPEDAPENGVELYVSAWDTRGTKDWQDDNRFGTGIKIEEGQRTGDYSIQVPGDSAEYVIEVNRGGQVNCVDFMFYGESGGAYSISGAKKVSMEGVEIREGIDLTLEHGKTITGKITLPEGTVIPAEGLVFRVEAYKENNVDDYEDDISISVKVPMNSLQTPYTLIVPAYDGYIVKYNLDDDDYDFMSQAYYKDGSMVYDYVDAQLFDLSEDGELCLTDIDLTVVESVSITGKVILPYTAQKYTTMWILAVDDNDTDRRDDDKGYGTLVEVQEGFDSADYKLKVPKDSQYPYFIELWGGSAFDCIDNLFYGGNGNNDTVYSPADALRIDISKDALSNRNLTLVEGKKISVTVKLPEGMKAPEGGYNFSVAAMRDNDPEKESDDVRIIADIEIDKDQSEYTFEMDIPKLDGYRLVVVSKEAEFEEALYYSGSGMTADISKACAINATTAEPLNFVLQTALTADLACTSAEVKDDGSAILLKFNKPLDGAAALDDASGSFTVMVEDSVGTSEYELSGVHYVNEYMALSLDLKDYSIFKDYKSVKVSYTGIAGIKAYDGKELAAFTDKSAENKSSKQLIISGAADDAFYNRDVTVTASSGGDTITIDDGSRTGTELKFETSGNFTVTVSSSRRKNPLSLSFEIDKVKPTVTIDVPAVTSNDHNGVKPGVMFSGDIELYRAITVNGRAYKAGTAIKEAGVYTITASTKDKAGNTGTATATFEIWWDTTAPVITVMNDLDNESLDNGKIYESAEPVISLSGGTNAANYTYTAKLKKPDGSIVTYVSGDTIDDEGEYRLEVLAVNPSYTDISSSKVIEFTIDNEAPTVEVSNVTNSAGSDKPFNTAVTPVITFTDNVASQQILAANAVITLTRDAVLVEGYKRGDTITADGTYTLTAKTEDEYGHESNLATKSFAIDRTKPVITISGAVNGNTYKDETITITVDKSEGIMTSVVKKDGEVIDWSGEAFEGEEGKVVTYDLEFTVVDEAGNEAVQTLRFTIDRLPVNISISGVTEGMVTNTDPYISFTVFEGEEEKQGATAKIDGVAFTGGRYSVAGNHTITVTYISGENTYTKSITFKLDKTVPQITAGDVMKNAVPAQADIHVKSGDIVKVTADITDAYGIGEVWFSIGSVAAKVPMKKTGNGNAYEGSFTVESGNYDNQTITVYAKDKAGNIASLNYTKTINIDNSKPVVKVTTSPAKADGSNGIYKNPNMKVMLDAAPIDRINYNFNGLEGNAEGTIELSPIQGTNVLLYYAVDLAGNQSDQKLFVFEYDSVKPANVSVGTIAPLVNSPVITITGSVESEVGKTGSRVLLKKAGEIVAQAVVSAVDGAFAIDGVRLAEGDNTLELTAIDRAGNESAATAVTTKLDSTAPIVRVEKPTSDGLIYNITVNEALKEPVSAKFNGAEIASDKIEITGALTYTIEVPGMFEGSNTLNVTAVDLADNIGVGSFTSTYIPTNTQQNDVPLNDNASMDIPAGAFTGTGSVQMLVRTVDVQGAESYKPLGAPISFEFNQEGTSVEPLQPLVIRNFIGTGLKGVMLMHIDDNNTVGDPVTAVITTSTEFDEAGMGLFEDGYAYYLEDTGYLIFKTMSFSAYQVAQDNTAPVITVTTTDFEISRADLDGDGKCFITGTLTDNDPDVHVSEVRINGTVIDISLADVDSVFSIPLSLTDGTHEVVVKAADSAGNTSSVTRRYNVDITPPTLTVPPVADKTNRNTLDLAFSVTEYADISIDGVSKGYFSGSDSIAIPLAEGSNVFRVKATDAMGNESAETTVSVTRDSTVPTINVTGISDGDIVGGPINITVSITDTHRDVSAESIKLDGVTKTSPITGYNTEGTHTLVVNAADTYGNASSETITFTIDNSAPVINITGADDGGIYGEAKTLTITASNAVSLKVTKSVNRGTAQEVANKAEPEALTASITLDPGADSYQTYTIRATAQKVVGVQVKNAVKAIEITIDKKKPVITSTTVSQTEAATIDITGTIDETADLFLDDVLVFEDKPAGTFRFEDKALVLGDNTFVVKAVDALGNTSTKTIVIKRVEPQQNTGGDTGGNNGGGGGGGFIPFIPGLEEEGPVILDPIPRKNSGSLPEVEEPMTGKATASAENTGISTSGGTVSTPDGAFKLDIPENTVNDQKNTFRIVVFELDPKSPLSLEEQITSGTIRLVSKVVDFSTDAEVMEKPVKATFKYDAKAVTDPANLRVFYWNVRTNAWVPVAMADTVIDAKNGTVEATLSHFTRYAVMEVKSTLKYADVQSQWHATYVERASLMGIINGFVTNGVREFRPNASLSRAEFVTMLVRTLKLDTSSEDVSVFKDAKDIAGWAKGYIKAAYDKGIITPYEDGTFKSAQSITREEMAVMLVKAMGLKPAGDAAAFKDQKDIPASVRPYVTKASELNILVGKGDGKFYPKDSLTRAEASKVIVEMVEVLGKL